MIDNIKCDIDIIMEYNEVYKGLCIDKTRSVFYNYFGVKDK